MYMNKRTFAITIAVIIILVIAGGSYYMFSRDTFESQGNPQELSQRDITTLVVRVGKHIQLPTNEDPLVATIVDVESLVADQPFYQGAQNGDVLLIYQGASKAIIYSPSRDILVNVGPIILDGEQNETATIDFESVDDVSGE